MKATLAALSLAAVAFAGPAQATVLDDAYASSEALAGPAYCVRGNHEATQRFVEARHFADTDARVTFKVRRDGVMWRTVIVHHQAPARWVAIRAVVRVGHVKSIEVYVDGRLRSVKWLRPVAACQGREATYSP